MQYVRLRYLEARLNFKIGAAVLKKRPTDDYKSQTIQNDLKYKENVLAISKTDFLAFGMLKIQQKYYRDIVCYNNLIRVS